MRSEHKGHLGRRLGYQQVLNKLEARKPSWLHRLVFPGRYERLLRCDLAAAITEAAYCLDHNDPDRIYLPHRWDMAEDELTQHGLTLYWYGDKAKEPDHAE